MIEKREIIKSNIKLIRISKYNILNFQRRVKTTRKHSSHIAWSLLEKISINWKNHRY